MEDNLSWGRWPRVSQELTRINWRNDPLPECLGRTLLPRGLGRSYGDSCLNEGNVLLDTSGLNRFIGFNREAGILRCEGGVTLDSILKLIVPFGWFLPVVPGTKFVTIGGALANDIHGKNHHRRGTLGCHVSAFELARSDGSRMVCSPSQNAGLFRATIGGLGLTGLITWVEVRLLAIQSAFIEVETIKFLGLSEFFTLSQESNSGYEYCVAWLDFSATGKRLGRGIFIRGNHSSEGVLCAHREPLVSVPFDFPNWALNPITVRGFNWFYYHRQMSRFRAAHSHYDPFFFPLDMVGEWNRIYGRRGFFQYQFVVPYESDMSAIGQIVARIARSRQGSFLAVIKTFGSDPSPGMLSFPRSGVTVALDFANGGQPTMELMKVLDEDVKAAGGTLYPAKDARMAPELFQQMYPQWREFSKLVDPRFSSSFWRRVTAEPAQLAVAQSRAIAIQSPTLA
jgi:FAD/FMN-containing dehydrogenase